MTSEEKMKIMLGIKRERADWTFLLDEIADLQKRNNDLERIISLLRKDLTT